MTALFLNRVGNFRQAITFWQDSSVMSAMRSPPGTSATIPAAEFGLGNLEAAERTSCIRCGPPVHAGHAGGLVIGHADSPCAAIIPPEAAALARRLLAASFPARTRTRLNAAAIPAVHRRQPRGASARLGPPSKAVANGDRSPESLDALLTMARVYILIHAPRRWRKKDLPPLAELARRIDAHPLAQMQQHLLVLDLRASAEPRQPALPSFQEGIDRYATTKDDAGLGTR